MANERPGGRRQGRPGGGGGYGDFRPRRSGPPRGGAPRPGTPGRFGEEAPRDFVPRPQRAPYPARSGGGYPSRSAADEGGMSIRVDPRRLSLLKELAAAEGLRPGQLVQRWVEERLDSERSGQATTSVPSGDTRVAALESSLAALVARIDEVTQRLQRVESSVRPATSRSGAQATEAPRRRRGRPPKAAVAGVGSAANTRRRFPEWARGPARRDHRGHPRARTVDGGRARIAIKERGRYQPPRSAKPLDAATVNSRVSNPA